MFVITSKKNAFSINSQLVYHPGDQNICKKRNLKGYSDICDKRFSERILIEAKNDLGALVIKHRFHIEIVEGTLCRHCFRKFVAQDILYLKKRLHLTELAYARFPSHDGLFKRLITGTEKELNFYNELFHDFEFSECYSIMDDACEVYVLFLKEIINGGNLVEVIAVLLPCLWIFQEIRNEYRNKVLLLSHDHPYYRFFKHYRESGISESTENLKIVLDDLLSTAIIEENDKMQNIVREIIYATIMHEYAFIDSLYLINSNTETRS